MNHKLHLFEETFTACVQQSLARRLTKYWALKVQMITLNKGANFTQREWR